MTNDCFVCQGPSKHYSYWKVFEYVQCQNCNLIYLKENPTEEQIYAAYDGGKLKNLRRKLVSPFRRLEDFKIYEEKMKTTSQIMDIVNQYVSEPGKKMMDIGCNKGFLLTQAINRGFIPYGIEIVPVLMDQFKRKFRQYRNNIYSENFSKVSSQVEDEYFDVVTAIDVVEHLQNPRDDFNNVFRILKKGGIFLAQTPDNHSKEAKEEKEHWGALKAYEHLILFDHKSLELLADQIGFSKVEYYEPIDKNIGNMLAVLTK